MKKLLISILCIITFISAVQTVAASEIAGTLTTAANSIVTPDPTFPAPEAVPNSGTFTSAQSVTLGAANALGIRYTLDGTIPNCASTSNASLLYSAPITINATATLKAIACYANDKSSTGFLYAIYTITTSEQTTNSNTHSDSGSITVAAGGGGGGGGAGGGDATPIILNVQSKGDANNDGKINILDFVVLMANWGKTGTNLSADFNGDAKVDILDFVRLMANWNK